MMSARDREYQELVKEIQACRRCPLHKARKNPVPGEGPLDAEIVFVGEAPGRREDEQGRPFVGMAGKILDSLLASIGLSRSRVYITNVVKCRPPGNRDPTPDEIRACLPFLVRQLRMIRPRIVVALGRISGKTLYELAGKKWRGISRERGKPVEARIAGMDVTLLATYHPAAALYNPRLRGVLEEDFKVLASLLQERRGTRDRRTLEDFLS